MTQKEEPVLAEAVLEPIKGGWMARSAPGSALRIAVVGASQEQARERFAQELDAWARLREDKES